MQGDRSLLDEFASLQQRLLDTERKLKNPDYLLNAHNPNYSPSSSLTSSPARSEPKLTLEDLTPSQSKYEWSYDANPATDVENSSLRKKLAMLREENSQLVAQNHSLLTELENASYELTQSQVKASRLVEQFNDSKKSAAARDHVVVLETKLSNQNDELKRCNGEIESFKLKIESLQIEVDSKENELLSMRDKDQNEQEIEKERLLEEQVYDLEEECKRLKAESVSERHQHDSLFEENSHLKLAVAHQSEQLAALESIGTSHRDVRAENERLKEIVSRQSLKLGSCEREIEKSKTDLERLSRKFLSQSSRMYNSFDGYQQHGDTTGYHSLHSSSDSVYRFPRLTKTSTPFDRAGEEIRLLREEARQLHDKVRKKNEKIDELKRQIGIDADQRSRVVDDLELALDEKSSTCARQSGQIAQLERKIGQLKVERKRHEDVEELKSLHAAQCRELERRLDQLEDQLAGRNSDVLKLQALLRATESQLESRGSEMSQLQGIIDDRSRKLEAANRENCEKDQALKNFQEEASSGSNMIVKLQEELGNCQAELETRIKEYDEELRNQKQEMSELEQMVRRERSELRQRSLRVSELERRLDDRQGMLEESANRVQELEENQAALEKRRCQLDVDLERSQNELVATEQRVRDIETGRRQDQEKWDTERKRLNDMVKEVVGKNESADDRLRKLAVSEGKLRGQVEVKNRELIETKKKTDALQKELRKAIEEGRLKQAKIFEFEQILSRLKTEVGQLETRTSYLEVDLERSRADVKERDGRIAEMNTALLQKQKELSQRSADVHQLDVALKRCRGEYQQRLGDSARKVATIEAEVKVKEAKMMETQFLASQLEERVKDKDEAMKERDKMGEQLRRKLEEVSQEKTAADQIVGRLQSQMSKMEEERAQAHQNLRLSREEQHRLQLEIDSVKDLLRHAESSNEATLDETERLRRQLVVSEEAARQMADELGKARGRESRRASRQAEEAKALRNQLESMQVQHRDEIARLQASHAKMIATKEQQAASHRLQVQRLQELNEKRSDELSRCREQASHLSTELESLHSQVERERQEGVMKEAELTRISTRLAMHERRSQQQQQQQQERSSPTPAESASDVSVSPPDPTIAYSSSIPESLVGKYAPNVGNRARSLSVEQQLERSRSLLASLHKNKPLPLPKNASDKVSTTT